MKKHLKKQFSGILAPILITLMTLYVYHDTEDLIQALEILIRMSFLIVGLYLYAASHSYETELETRKEYEPEEPEV